MANLERLARERLGARVGQVHHNRWIVSVVFGEPVDARALEELFSECHVHPVSRVQVGLA